MAEFSSRIRPWLAAVVAALTACAGRGAPYTPQTRELTVTTVPLLVKEGRTVYPFLAADFARGGVLEGKEVYAFSPSTLTVVEGDTVHFTFYNPEDDEHGFFIPNCDGEQGESFVLPDCAVRLPPQTVTHASYIARHAGVYPFMCIVAKHVPMMHGQLVVLAPAAL
ncbi:MAG TPA: hypothetical protein VH439_09800 [Gemmatimonadales bacterium]